MVTRFTKMAYESPDDMLFGHSKKPVSYGFGIKAGAGRVIPEINYAPRPGTDKTVERITKEYVDYIAKDAISRAVTLGFPDLQLETEWISSMGTNRDMAASIVSGQKVFADTSHREFGINLAIRHTVPDQRIAENGLRPGMDRKNGHPERLIENCEIACENGADVLSVESVGGKEFADYAVTHGDITAFLFGVGYLGSMDMAEIWTEMVSVCRKHRCVAGRDSDCSGANVATFMAGGTMDSDVQKTFSAVTRCIAAARTLVAQECGATGPDKDCGYEGIICKAVCGMPASQEGKNSQCAHSDMQGNLMAQCADLWSNESVEYHPEFGGSSVQCWLGPLGYECSLMNTAITTGQGKVLRDLYMISDRTRSPEGYVLSYDNAWKVGKAIVQNSGSYYLRAKAAGLEGARIVREGYEKKELVLSAGQLETLDGIIAELESLPDDEDRFYDLCTSRYKGLVQGFNPRSYGL